jgi:hypothetical protein
MVIGPPTSNSSTNQVNFSSAPSKKTTRRGSMLAKEGVNVSAAHIAHDWCQTDLLRNLNMY